MEVERYLKTKYFISSSLPPVTDGLLIELNGDDYNVQTNGTDVNTWNDQASLGGLQNFAQSSSAYRPTVNNIVMPKGTTHNVIDLDGVDDYFGHSSDSSFDTNTFTIFAVTSCDTLSDANSGALFWSGYNYISGTNTASATSAWGIGESGSINGWSYFARDVNGNQKSIRHNNSTDSIWYVTSMVWDGTTGSVKGRFFDASSNLDILEATGANANPHGHIRARIGAVSWTTPNLYYNGQVAEILVYNRALSSTEVLSVESFLKEKYLINLGTAVIIR